MIWYCRYISGSLDIWSHGFNQSTSFSKFMVELIVMVSNYKKKQTECYSGIHNQLSQLYRTFLGYINWLFLQPLSTSISPIPWVDTDKPLGEIRMPVLMRKNRRYIQTMSSKKKNRKKRYKSNHDWSLCKNSIRWTKQRPNILPNWRHRCIMHRAPNICQQDFSIPEWLYKNGKIRLGCSKLARKGWKKYRWSPAGKQRGSGGPTVYSGWSNDHLGFWKS